MPTPTSRRSLLQVPMRTINPSSFSTQAWERNAPAYEAIRTMPFNTELAAGVGSLRAVMVVNFREAV